MKVVQVLYSGLGGHASVVFSLVDGDIEKKWQHSLVFYGIEPLNGEYAKKAADRQLNYVAIQAETGKPWKSWKLFYHQLKAAAPDVILLHSSSLLIPAWWYCRRHRKKLVTIEHTPNQVKRKSEKWTSILSQYFSHRVVLLTDDYREELQEILGKHFHAKKNFVIPNGIDTGYFVPALKERNKAAIKLGMAARFSLQKDQALLIDVMEQLQKDNYTQFQLSLAGGGEELDNIKSRALQKGVNEKLCFTGNLDEPGLLSFYQGLDIYLHASKGETMSTSIMQAMSCGLPVIASDIPGINNLLNEDTGFLVNHTVPAFVTAIKELYNDPLAGDKGGNARKFAEDHFSHKKMFDLYNQLIQKICIEERYS